MVRDYEDDEVFRDINSFYKRLMERMLREMEDFEKAVKSGQLEGDWSIKPVDKSGVKGYVAQGRFRSGGKPLRVQKSLVDEEREPLVDVFDEGNSVRVYVELPGVEKDDVQLDVTEAFMEVKAKNFFKRVELPSGADFAKATACCKNGVLVVTVPKVGKAAVDAEKRRTVKID